MLGRRSSEILTKRTDIRCNSYFFTLCDIHCTTLCDIHCTNFQLYFSYDLNLTAPFTVFDASVPVPVPVVAIRRTCETWVPNGSHIENSDTTRRKVTLVLHTNPPPPLCPPMISFRKTLWRHGTSCLEQHQCALFCETGHVRPYILFRTHNTIKVLQCLIFWLLSQDKTLPILS